MIYTYYTDVTYSVQVNNTMLSNYSLCLYRRWHVLLSYSEVSLLSLIMLVKGIVQRFIYYLCLMSYRHGVLSLGLDRPVLGLGFEW